MKCLLKPTTPFMLMLEKGEVVEAHRPSVVSVTATVQTRLASGKLKLIAPDLPDTANDADFLKFWREAGRDEALAIDSYLSQFKLKEEVAPEVTEEPVAPKRRK